MTKLIAGAVVLSALFATPAFADYWIVKENSGCQIVSSKPESTVTVMDNGKVFTTRSEAEKQMKVVCKE